MNRRASTVLFVTIVGCLLAGLTSLAGAQQSAAQQARKLFAAGSTTAAKDALFACADAQNAECQFLLAQKVEEGKHFFRDLTTAKRLYELSYRGGYAPAGAHVLRLAKEIPVDGDSPATTETKPTKTTAEVPATLPEFGKLTPIEALPPLAESKNKSTAVSPASSRSHGPPTSSELSQGTNFELCVLLEMLGEARRNAAEVARLRGLVSSELQARNEDCTPREQYRSAALIEIEKIQAQNKPSKGTKALSVIADIVGAIGKGMASGSRRGYGGTSTSGAYAGTDSCMSDYNCGPGKICVKAPYKSRGQCMTSVDEYGLRTFDGPRDNSIGPSTSPQCTFDLNCPIGFDCDRELKACVKR